MPQRSAGLLLYRHKGRAVEVLLVHPGGPFWAKKDEGAWSIPKGVIEPGEDPVAVARREFEEETGARPGGDLIPLGSFAQSRAKTIELWAAEGDFDPATLTSNTFTMEWPPRSGRMQDFPEVDRAQWFAPAEAEVKILKGQRPVLQALLDYLAIPAEGRSDPARRPRVSPQPMKQAATSPIPRAPPKTSATYKLFRRAIIEEKQVTCLYQGKYREICPVIIGHTGGSEKVLAFQLGGETGKEKGPPDGQWKCFFVADVRDARLRDGSWHEGKGHKTMQRCVTDVDLDINIHVRKRRA